MEIKLFSQPIINKITTSEKVYPKNSIVQFAVEYNSLGEPSCTLITINNLYNFNTGSSLSTCSSLFPTTIYTYLHNYIKDENKFYFNLTMNSQLEGIVEIKGLIKNFVVSKYFSTKISISNLLCTSPNLDINLKSDSFLNPIVFKRSELISIIAYVTLNCNITLENSKQWSLMKLNELDGSIIKQIDLSSNPSSTNAELVIKQNTLEYGLYKISVKVSMIGAYINNLFQSESITYIKVIATGINVLALKQNKRVAIGINQTLILDPVSSSFDYDNLVDVSTLSFQFFCSVVDNGISKDYPKINFYKYIDLNSLKTLDWFPMDNNITCFGNRGILSI